MNCAEKGIHIEAGRENKLVCLCGNIFCSCAVVVVVVVSLFHDIFSRFVVSVMDALSSVLGAFDEGGVVADAFFPVESLVHAARAAENARVRAFHVSRAVSRMRLQRFSLGAAELESCMGGAVGSFFASAQVECSRDGLACGDRAPAPSSGALLGLEFAVGFAFGHESGFGLEGGCSLGAAGTTLGWFYTDRSGFAGEFLAVSFHALLP